MSAKLTAAQETALGAVKINGVVKNGQGVSITTARVLARLGLVELVENGDGTWTLALPQTTVPTFDDFVSATSGAVRASLTEVTEVTEEPQEIKAGTTFDTPFERGCVALSSPDDMGHFTARDSDGVECEFSVNLVCRPGSGHTVERNGGDCSCTRPESATEETSAALAFVPTHRVTWYVNNDTTRKYEDVILVSQDTHRDYGFLYGTARVIGLARKFDVLGRPEGTPYERSIDFGRYNALAIEPIAPAQESATEEIKAGTTFNTPFERGCIALATPDSMGHFMATDSDGVDCEFGLVMVCRPGSEHTFERNGNQHCDCTRPESATEEVFNVFVDAPMGGNITRLSIARPNVIPVADFLTDQGFKIFYDMWDAPVQESADAVVPKLPASDTLADWERDLLATGEPWSTDMPGSAVFVLDHDNPPTEPVRVIKAHASGMVEISHLVTKIRAQVDATRLTPLSYLAALEAAESVSESPKSGNLRPVTPAILASRERRAGDRAERAERRGDERPDVDYDDVAIDSAGQWSHDQ